MGNKNSGRYSNEKRAKINAAIAAQPSLFGDEPILPYKLDNGETNFQRKYIYGKDNKERLDYIKTQIYCEPTMSLEDYCRVIYEWLRINSDTYTVLDYYEDDNNQPFEYSLEEVMCCPIIAILLEQRIGRDGMNGKLKGTLVSTLLANKYSWVTSRTASKVDTNLTSDGPIKFEFGE